MNYPNILGKVWREFWAIRPEKHEAILSVLESRLGGAVLSNSMDDDGSEIEYFTDGDMAVIPIDGILGKHLSAIEMMCGGCSMDKVSAMLDSAERNSEINKILLYINSPGGMVTGTPELAKKIANLSKTTIAFTDCDCCSGAIWLASQAEYFYASESSCVGSVGVRMILLDESRALDNEGIKVNPIYSGKYKLSGASFKPLTNDEREMFQTESDRIHEQFKVAMTSNRDISKEFLEGQIFRGEQAAKIGMIDGLVDDLDEAIAMGHSVSDEN